MQPWEAEEALRNLAYTQRGEWERARLLAYIMVQSRSRDKLSPQDILKFSWEQSARENMPISDEDKQRLAAKAAFLSKHITEGLD